MAWIESHDDIWDHWKTIQLAESLGISDVQAVGHLMSLWHFVLRNAWRDADLSRWGDAGIERATRWTGKPGAMAEALRQAGFLKGSTAHGWMERAGKLVKDRLYNEGRKNENGELTNKNGVSHRKSSATVPYRTSPNRTQPLTVLRPAGKSAGKLTDDELLSMRMPFGDHKGVLVANLDPERCQWLLERFKGQKAIGPQLRAALELRLTMKRLESGASRRSGGLAKAGESIRG